MESAAGIEACLESLEDHISVVAAGTPLAEQGESFQEMCRAFQGLAIFYLLDDINLTRYHWNLQRGVQARLFYLRKLKEEGGVDPVFTALSRTDSVFDAIVTGDLPGTAGIRALSSPDWLPKGEYEDDYWYFETVHAVAKGSLTEAARHLSRFEGALDDRPDPRLPLCRTFIDGNQESYWTKFAEFTEARLASCAIEHDDGRLVEQPWLAACAHVSMEAVAWMKMALARGYQPAQSEYPMCPALALRPSPAGPSPDIFLELETHFAL